MAEYKYPIGSFVRLIAKDGSPDFIDPSKYKITGQTPVSITLKGKSTIYPGYWLENCTTGAKKIPWAEKNIALWEEVKEETKCTCDLRSVIMVTGCRCEVGQKELAEERSKS